MIQIARAFLLITALAVGSCSPMPTIDPREVVLLPGQSIHAENMNGSITVTYISKYKRKFEWDGHNIIQTMNPRTERLYGRMGLVGPEPTFYFGKEGRLLTNEYSIFCKNEDEVRAFLYEGSAIMDWVYTRDGLALGFGKTPGRDQVDVDIVQIYVDGRKPEIEPRGIVELKSEVK